MWWGNTRKKEKRKIERSKFNKLWCFENLLTANDQMFIITKKHTHTYNIFLKLNWISLANRSQNAFSFSIHLNKRCTANEQKKPTAEWKIMLGSWELSCNFTCIASREKWFFCILVLIRLSLSLPLLISIHIPTTLHINLSIF